MQSEESQKESRIPEEQSNNHKDRLIEEELNFNKPDFVFIPKGSHQWNQKGYYLICTTCEIEHGTWIGQDKMMIGVKKDGQPILKDRRELNMA